MIPLFCYPCSGTYYAENSADAQSIYNQFGTNCCKGSRITIYNDETGIGGSYVAQSDGVNSSCATFSA